MTVILANDPDAELARTAQRIRRFALRMGRVQGQGYVGQALGWADVLAVAYGHAMNFRPEDPEWDGRDRFVLLSWPLRYRLLRRPDRIRHHSRGRTGDVRLRRQPSADDGHGGLHAGHGDLRRLARPRIAHRGRHGAGAAPPGESGVRLQFHVRRRTGRRIHVGSGDGREPSRSFDPHLHGRHQQSAKPTESRRA
jgi:transketolase